MEATGRRLRQYLRAIVAALLLGVGVAVLGGALLASSALDQPARRAAELRQAAALVPDVTERAKLQKDIAQYETDNQIKTWTTVVQALGAMVLGVGGYFAYRNLQVAQENLRATQVKLDVDREGQVTNRFTQATGQLGAVTGDGRPNLEVRLGGIYSLEQIARDAPEKYHWPIMEVLTAYLHQNAPWPSSSAQSSWFSRSGRRGRRAKLAPLFTPLFTPLFKPRADVQAIMTVLARRSVGLETDDDRHLDLHTTDLRRVRIPFGGRLGGTNLAGAYLEGVWLPGGDLKGARLDGAHLKYAHMPAAHLEEAYLASTNLEDAWLKGANLERANLGAARLDRAMLNDACLVHTRMGNAHLERAHLRSARLVGARLVGAHLEEADLDGARLEQADLDGADLRRAVNLTQAQVWSASGHGKGALLPEDWPKDWRDTFRDGEPASSLGGGAEDGGLKGSNPPATTPPRHAESGPEGV